MPWSFSLTDSVPSPRPLQGRMPPPAPAPRVAFYQWVPVCVCFPSLNGLQWHLLYLLSPPRCDLFPGRPSLSSLSPSIPDENMHPTGHRFHLVVLWLHNWKVWEPGPALQRGSQCQGGRSPSYSQSEPHNHSILVYPHFLTCPAGALALPTALQHSCYRGRLTSPQLCSGRAE